MLAIEHEPQHKSRIFSRIFLSVAAVILGFVLTVAVIRLTNPADISTKQLAQPASERRASSLTPIPSSSSESSSENN